MVLKDKDWNLEEIDEKFFGSLWLLVKWVVCSVLLVKWLG